MSCHSEFVSNVFSRLDYAGIALLICGSSITWLYFGFYCEFYYKLTYIISIAVLGILTIVITMMEKFNRPVSNTITISSYFREVNNVNNLMSIANYIYINNL